LLDRGNRVLELDVFPPDANGNLPVKHDEAGNGLDINNCRAFDGEPGAGGYLADCLSDIQRWIVAHPNDLPISLQIDLKSYYGGNNWNETDFAGLERAIKAGLPDLLITPDEVRRFTGYSSLREGVFYRGWPSIGEMRGRVMVQMTGGPWEGRNPALQLYALRMKQRAAMFVCPDIDSKENFIWDRNAFEFTSEAANDWVVCGNVRHGDRAYEKTEYAMRNRQLVNLFAGDVWYFSRFDRMYSAVGWGASMISRDDTETWGGKLPLYGLRGSVPMVFTLRNRVEGQCAGLRTGTSVPGNETAIIQVNCDSKNVQSWIYGDETLRRAGGTKYCMDVEGGAGYDGALMHLWDCDGGSSEKWQLQPDGRFFGVDGFCASMPQPRGRQLNVATCSADQRQVFKLIGKAANNRGVTLPLAD
jgi:hypothetical protein